MTTTTLSEASDRSDLAKSACATLVAAVRALPDGPVLLPSYPAWEGRVPDDPALRTVAFTYDNALASIALFGCGESAAARRIADALVIATRGDVDFKDGRVRNAYAAGPVKDAITLAGYWDASRNTWIQDPYQMSFATGNAAWAALALLDAHRHTRDASYLDAARRVLDWTAQATRDEREPAGFIGGFFVRPAGLERQAWKSTEHNVDLAAAFAGLDRARPDAGTKADASLAAAFVAAQWDAQEGRFLVGTQPDGRTPDRDRSGLDAQAWPLIALATTPDEWLRAIAYVDGAFAVKGGYGFMRSPDGVWTEGTAQMAAVFVLRGLAARADALWPVLLAQRTQEGWLYATPEPHIRTGLAIGPDSVTDDFLYYRQPHLGATAWAAIAAKGVNPFR